MMNTVKEGRGGGKNLLKFANIQNVCKQFRMTINSKLKCQTETLSVQIYNGGGRRQSAEGMVEEFECIMKT